VIDEDSSAGCVNTCFQEQSRQGVTQSTGYNTGFIGNGNTFFHSVKSRSSLRLILIRFKQESTVDLTPLLSLIVSF